MAWRKIKQYKAEGKSLGEIASDVISLATQAATEADVRQRLALETFLEALPWKFALEIKKKKLDSVEEALKEVRLLQMLEDEEGKRQKKGKFSLKERQNEHKFIEKKKSEFRRTEITCWGCGKKGHTLQNCRKFQAFKQQEQGENVEENGGASNTAMATTSEGAHTKTQSN